MSVWHIGCSERGFLLCTEHGTIAGNRDETMSCSMGLSARDSWDEWDRGHRLDGNGVWWLRSFFTVLLLVGGGSHASPKGCLVASVTEHSAERVRGPPLIHARGVLWLRLQYTLSPCVRGVPNGNCLAPLVSRFIPLGLIVA